jgi:DNA modification methylase
MEFEFPSSTQVYGTKLGVQLCDDSRNALKRLPEESVDLIVTSPPFALLRKKSYGNEDQADYVNWLSGFGAASSRALKKTGSFVLDLGGAYQRGRPVRSLYNYRVLLNFCDNLGYQLAEEFFWYNPAKLPSPIEWVNKRKVRVKDAVNTVWWFSKTDNPKANVSNVLAPYSERMRTLLKNPGKFYRPKGRPSGHDIAESFGNDKGGAIPPNLLQIPNTDSNSHYLRFCKSIGAASHPARFPEKLPEFFIKFLTEQGDLVLDIFSGSNTTGYVAEKLGRRWVSIESNRHFAALSFARFTSGWSNISIQKAVAEMERGKTLVLDGDMSKNEPPSDAHEQSNHLRTAQQLPFRLT